MSDHPVEFVGLGVDEAAPSAIGVVHDPGCRVTKGQCTKMNESKLSPYVLDLKLHGPGQELHCCDVHPLVDPGAVGKHVDLGKQCDHRRDDDLQGVSVELQKAVLEHVAVGLQKAYRFVRIIATLRVSISSMIHIEHLYQRPTC